ncbi:transposase [Sporohalobacter salinus]|uniref:transposase n=1 Tax=Sporohalobacter salinus TaxID=1494606 RepID=UPI0019605A80|nr:transposase [Sporohalobacter salinus]MBM7624963.1 transposase-like protein [Sporohalobacter salinus]
MPKGKTYDSEFKMELVLEVLKGRKAFEVADEYNVSCNSIYNWKQKFLNGGLSGLTNDNQIKSQKDAELKEKEQQIQEMKKIIGEQKVQMELLKKKLWQD